MVDNVSTIMYLEHMPETTIPEPQEGTMNENTVTGWAALPVIREADALYLAGDIAGRNALLRTVDPTMWNGREILPEQ